MVGGSTFRNSSLIFERTLLMVVPNHCVALSRSPPDGTPAGGACTRSDRARRSRNKQNAYTSRVRHRSSWERHSSQRGLDRGVLPRALLAGADPESDGARPEGAP